MTTKYTSGMVHLSDGENSFSVIYEPGTPRPYRAIRASYKTAESCWKGLTAREDDLRAQDQDIREAVAACCAKVDAENEKESK